MTDDRRREPRASWENPRMGQGEVPWWASWKAKKQPRQVGVFDSGMTNDELADVMDRWAWLGDIESLEQGFTVRLKRKMRAQKLSRPGRAVGMDDVYEVWPADLGARPPD